MTDRDAFIQTIAQNVYDDAPRLVFADWLDEHGEEALAEFIRVQVELEPIRDLYEIPRAVELHAREDKLLENRKVWLANLPEGCEAWDVGVNVDFRRGFPDILRCSAKAFIQYGPQIRKQYPTIRRTVIHCLNGWGQRLSECAGLEGLAELELACWYSSEDLEVLGDSEHLSQLQVLVLWMGHRIGLRRENRLCQIAAEAESWPYLREIVLFDPQGEDKIKIEKLVKKTDTHAGQKIARYQRGYPELFPLKADFFRYLPVAGRLPNGRAAVLYDLWPTTVPWELTVQTFNEKGVPYKKNIIIPIPSELKEIDWKDANNQDGKYTQVARDAVGFETGLIRIQENTLLDGNGPYMGHRDIWALCGREDNPEDPVDMNDDVYPDGFGGLVYRIIDGGDFVVDGGGWADKRGVVHST